MKQKKNEKTDIRPYTKAFFHKNRLLFGPVLAATLLSTLDSLFCSWSLGKGIDIFIGGKLRDLAWLLLVFVAGELLFFAVSMAEYRLKARFLRRAMSQYKSRIFEQLSGKSISAFNRENTGRYLSILTNDMNTIEENYLNRSILIAYYVVLLALTLAMMLYYSWELTLAALVLSAIPLLSSLRMSKKLTLQEKKVSDCNESYVSTMKDLLTGFSVIKSFKAERQARKLFNQASGVVEAEKERRRWWNGLLDMLANCCGILMQFGIFLLGCFFAMRGRITVGAVLVFTNLCNFLLTPIRRCPPIWPAGGPPGA